MDLTGCYIISNYINKDEKRIDSFLTMARQAANSSNKVLASDIVSSLCLLDANCLDFHDLYISNGHFMYLSLEGKEIMRLSIYDSIIEKLDLTNTKMGNGFSIEKCIIEKVFGISSRNSIPAQIFTCEVENFEKLATITLIKRARLSESQKLFVEIIRKIFFQHGAGRKEAALLRGMGALSNRSLSQKILNILLDENIVTRHKGDEGYIYKPVRSETPRMDKIITNLTLCKDPLWNEISSLS